MNIQDCKVGDIVVERLGSYLVCFYKVLKVNRKTVKLVHLEKESRDTSTEYIMKIDVKPTDEVYGEPENKKDISRFSPYDPTRTYYEVIY